MSVLETPRIYFKGEIAWDPITTNNYPAGTAPAGYDENACEPTLNGTPAEKQVAAFRQAAIDEIVSAGNWNPHGSYRSPFYNSIVSGVDIGAGLDTVDSFVNAPVDFTGMLIDCEPYGATSSQLFFDDISFGIAGGCRVVGRRAMRIHDRFINFAANPANNMIAGVASVMWQTCFPKGEGLGIDAHDSAVLKALVDALDHTDVAGLMLRFTTYRTVYYADPTLANGSHATKGAGAALQAKIAAGGFQPNPARSLLVGTLGLWRQNEVPTEACDRALVSTMATLPGQPSAANRGPVVGTAFARVGKAAITLDLSNAIPCTNRACDKFDLGELTLIATDPPPAVAIAEIAKISPPKYDRAAYEATSGIVDIPLTPELAASLAGTDLSIKGPDGTTYLYEAPLRAVPLAPNLYVNQGESASAVVQVYQRGVPAEAGVGVTMSELQATQPTHVRFETDATGRVTFPLSTGNGSVIGLVFQPGENPVLPIGSSFNPLVQTYMYLRVLPSDDEIAKMPPTWLNVHTQVLANWEAMAPCMDNWLRLGDEAQVLRYAKVIRKLTDPANFEALRYMPPTRDLTVGQRKLLYSFLDQGGHDVKAVVATPEVTEIDVHKLSRAMRSH